MSASVSSSACRSRRGRRVRRAGPMNRGSARPRACSSSRRASSTRSTSASRQRTSSIGAAQSRVGHHVDGQPAQPDRQRALDHVDQRGLTHRAAGAVDHDRDVPGDPVRGRRSDSTVTRATYLTAASRFPAGPPLRSRRCAGTRRLDRGRQPGRGAGAGRRRAPPPGGHARGRRARPRDRALGRRRHLVDLARDAFARGRGVVACGGDGTVCALAGVAAETDGVLGIVPVGSGNDFARQLDIPRGDLDAAIDVLRTGRVAAVDLGRVHTADGATTWFTTVANTGFDAERQRVGEPGHLDERHPALRAGHLAHARDLLAPPVPHHRRRRDGRHRRVAGRRRQHPHVRERDDDHPARPACTTACSTCAWSVPCHGSISCARSRRCSAARTSTTRRCSTWRGVDVTVEALDAAAPIELWASGEHAGPLPATRRTGGGRAGGDGARDRYLTVSVPSMPWARCPVIEQ